MDERMERSEVIERDAWTDLYRRSSGALRRTLGLEVETRGGVTFLSAARSDHLLLNRAIGLGHAGTPDPDAVAAAVRHYERRGIERYWIHLASHFRHSALPRELGVHGVVPYPRSWMKFARRASPVAPARCVLRIRAGRPEDRGRILELVAPSFDMPGEAGAVLTSAVGAKGWHYFVAEEGERIVAASALYARGRDALLVFAATAPEARRRGCQRAMMAERLERAQRLGCEYTFTETGLPVAGEPGSSYRNILRAGFDELYVRDNFAPEGTHWQSHPSSDASKRSSGSIEPSRTPPTDAVRSGT